MGKYFQPYRNAVRVCPVYIPQLPGGRVSHPGRSKRQLPSMICSPSTLTVLPSLCCEYERGTVADAAVFSFSVRIVHVPSREAQVQWMVLPGSNRHSSVKRAGRRPDYLAALFIPFRGGESLQGHIRCLYRLPYSPYPDDHTGIGQVAFRYCLVIIAPFRIDFCCRIEFKSD